MDTVHSYSTGNHYKANVIGSLTGWAIILLVMAGWAFVFSLSVPAGMGLLFAVSFVCVVLFNPFLVTLAVVFAMRFGPLLNLPVTADGFPLYLVMLFCAFVVWTVKALIMKDGDLIVTPLSRQANILVLALLAIMLISLKNSPDIGVSLKIIKRYIYCVVLYFFVLFTVKDTKQLKQLLTAALVSAFLVCILGIVEAASGQVLYALPLFDWKSVFGAEMSIQVLAIEANRIAGPFGDAEAHIIHMITFFFISLSLFIVVRSKLGRCCLAVLMLFFLANVFGTAYKVGIFAFGISFLVFGYYAGFRHRWAVFVWGFGLMAAIFLVLLVTLPELNIERLTSMRGEAGEHARLRIRNASMALKMFSDYPVLGNGPDGFTIRYPKFSLSYPNAPRHVLTAHNQYLQFLCEQGIVGISLFLFLIGSVARTLFVRIKKSNGLRRELAVAVLASLCAYAIIWLGSSLFLDLSFWLLIAIAAMLDTIPESDLAR